MNYVILTLKKMFRYILKPLSFLPALCMMYLIFSFSSQSGPQSSELSLSVSEKLLMAAGSWSWTWIRPGWPPMRRPFTDWCANWPM